MARMTEAIDLRELTRGGVEFQIDANYVKESEDSDDDSSENHYAFLNKETAGFFDEDEYEDAEPFEVMGRKMFDLVPDGRIKKRIIREGDGEKPMEHALVTIHYNAYIEYNDEPFDSTYQRKKPRKFILDDGRVIAGLDFAVQSMRLHEKSQFLIHPDYAFGKSPLIGPVPANATVLFEVELLDIVNSGAIMTFESLPEDQQQLFSEVYKYCIALCERGKKFFSEHDYKKAIKDYNTAATKLEKVTVFTKDEKEKQRELALKLYSNLLICYTRNDEPRKGCKNAEKIYKLTENGELLKIPAKVYFNHAKCLRILEEYEDAKIMLDKAYKKEPKNPEIANEMLNLEKDRMEHKKTRKLFAEALVGKV